MLLAQTISFNVSSFDFFDPISQIHIFFGNSICVAVYPTRAGVGSPRVFYSSAVAHSFLENKE